MKVVCIDDRWYHGALPHKEPAPKKHEIYNVIEQKSHDGYIYFKLLGFIEWFNSTGFRSIDEQFGSDVCERIEREMEQIQSPMIALFALRLQIHEDSLEHLKKLI